MAKETKPAPQPLANPGVPRSSEWWEEQARRYKAEAAEVNTRCDQLAHDNKQLLAKCSHLREQLDTLQEQVRALQPQE